MELIMVNSVKLKIILSPKDMEEMDITNDTLDYNCEKTRKAFRTILERAKIETGFDIKHDRVYVQVFPSVDGGCEMFLTKRGQLLPEPKKEGTYFRKKYKLVSDLQSERKAYIADSAELDDVISLCLRMKAQGFSGKSSLYYLDGRYYLLTDFSKKFPSFVMQQNYDEDIYRFSFMSDYADMHFAENLPLACIAERGKAILKEKAVETVFEKFGSP